MQGVLAEASLRPKDKRGLFGRLSVGCHPRAFVGGRKRRGMLGSMGGGSWLYRWACGLVGSVVFGSVFVKKGDKGGQSG